MNLFGSKPSGGRRGRHAQRGRTRARSGITAAAVVGLLAVVAPQALAATPPAAPTGLVISAISGVGSGNPPQQFSVTLRWNDKASDEDGFVVERATASAGAWQTAATVPAHAGTGTTTATVQLAWPLEYYLRVRAYNAAGSSLGPDVVATVPAALVNFKWTYVGHTEVVVSFDDAAINERNTYLFQANPDGSQQVIHTWGTLNGGTHTWTATGLEQNTTYVFHVGSLNNVGMSLSGALTIKTLGEICPHC
jgi:hypothetical protein